jgi:hypothetical protein
MYFMFRVKNVWSFKMKREEEKEYLQFNVNYS